MSLASTGDFLELTARPGAAPLLGEGSPEVPIWGYDGAVPGPIIRGRKGGTIRVRFRNELDQPTSIHWHGIRIENSMDGVAGLTQPAVEPGDTFDYVFAVPDAGTFWYHAHNRSWEQVERGLYGALIVDEAEPAFAPAQDVTLVLDDWRVSPSGRIDEGFGDMGDWSHGGRLGNWLTINGATRPDIPLAAGRTSRVRSSMRRTPGSWNWTWSRWVRRSSPMTASRSPRRRRLPIIPSCLGPANGWTCW